MCEICQRLVSEGGLRIPGTADLQELGESWVPRLHGDTSPSRPSGVCSLDRTLSTCVESTCPGTTPPAPPAEQLHVRGEHRYHNSSDITHGAVTPRLSRTKIINVLGDLSGRFHEGVPHGSSPSSQKPSSSVEGVASATTLSPPRTRYRTTSSRPSKRSITKPLHINWPNSGHSASDPPAAACAQPALSCASSSSPC